MSLVFGLKRQGAWLMLCVQGGRLQARTELRWNLSASPDTALLQPCRMSLVFGLKGEGAWLMLSVFGVNRLQERNRATNDTPQKFRQEMLCVHGGHLQARTERWNFHGVAFVMRQVGAV
jgi:hypothetical protein